jgi:hypothetical protein
MRRIVELELHVVLVNQKLSESQNSKNLELPLPMNYSGDPYKISDLLFNVQNFFKLAKMDDALAASYAGTLLTEYAASWWVSYRPSHQNITWAEFKNAIT